MKTLSVEEAKQQLETLIASSMNDHDHFRVTSDEGTVVMIPEETYNNIIVTLELLSTPGLFDSIKKKEVIKTLANADLLDTPEHAEVM